MPHTPQPTCNAMPPAGSQKLSDELMFSVTRIVCETPDGPRSGTGFFFAFLLENGKRSPCLITSRHVVEGARDASFFIRPRDAEGRVQHHRELEVKLPNLEDKVHPHPDPSVDLVLVFIGATLHALRTQGHDYRLMYLSRSAILPAAQAEALSVLEEVVVMGYPVGVPGPAPAPLLLRRGITATHARLPFEGACAFLIDAPTSPGMAGAPVFMRVPAFTGEDPVGQHSPGVALVGMLNAWRHADGEVESIVGRPGHDSMAVLVQQPLGLVIGTDKILDFEPLVRAMIHGYVSKY